VCVFLKNFLLFFRRPVEMMTDDDSEYDLYFALCTICTKFHVKLFKEQMSLITNLTRLWIILAHQNETKNPQNNQIKAQKNRKTFVNENRICFAYCPEQPTSTYIAPQLLKDIPAGREEI